jgi:hypothetical protein
MLISFNGPVAFGPHLYAKLPYDRLKDLAPVIIVDDQENGGADRLTAATPQGP